MSSDDEPRTDWPFGPFLSEAIKRSGLSKRRVALAAQISEGRLRQLETGFQKSGGMRIPISTTINTVTNLAAVLNFDIYEGLKLAGLESAIPDDDTRRELDESWRQDQLPPTNPALALFSVEDLLAEVQARFDRLEIPKVGQLSQWVTNDPGRPIPARKLVATDDELEAMTPRRRAEYRAEVQEMLSRMETRERSQPKLSDRRPTVADLKGLPSAAEPLREDDGSAEGDAEDGWST